MKLRHKLVLYLAAIHLGFAGAFVLLLWSDRLWLLPVEALLLISFVLGYHLLRKSYGMLETIQAGARFLDEQDFSCRLVPAGQPEVDQLISVYNRMTECMREERIRLEEQHYFLGKVVDASPSGIITFDYESRIDTINPAGERLLRVRGTEIIGRKLQEMGIEIAAELAAIPVGASRILSLGGWRRLQCAKSEFRDRGFPREFIMIEELTEALRLSEKSAYEKLIRLMSHEVNNTVAAANSLLHSCLHYAGQLKSEDQRDFQTALNAVIARSGELNRFMREFSEVARIPNPKPHSCSLIGLLEQVRVFLEQELARRRIVWRWDASDDPFPVLLDRGQMEQVFVNIIRNAMEAIDEDGTITVRIDRTGSHLWVAIEDSGPGILPEHREQLFTPFFSTKQNGQGIGLTLVREILENHGFEFRLESQAGGPTRFIIFLF